MTWVVILAVGAGSFVFRLTPLLVFERVSLGPRGDLIIRNAGTAAIPRWWWRRRNTTRAVPRWYPLSWQSRPRPFSQHGEHR